MHRMPFFSKSFLWKVRFISDIEPKEKMLTFQPHKFSVSFPPTILIFFRQRNNTHTHTATHCTSLYTLCILDVALAQMHRFSCTGSGGSSCMRLLLLVVLGMASFSVSATLDGSSGRSGEGALPRTSAPSLFESEPSVTDLSRGSDILSSASTGPAHIRHSLRHDAAACPVLLIYYDSTCGHCRTMAPRISEFARRTFLRHSRQRNPPPPHVVTEKSATNATDTGTDHKEGGDDDNDEVIMATLQIGAVNCAAHLEDCTRQNISDVPTFLFVPQAPTSGVGDASSVILPQTISSSEDLFDAVRFLLRPIVAAMPPGQRDVCALTKHFCFKQKKLRVAAETHPRSERRRADSGTPTTTFTEDRVLHASDIVASLFHALFHEVPLVPLVPAAQQTLKNFLELVHKSLPGLARRGLSPLIELLGKGDGLILPSEWQSMVIDLHLPVDGLAPWYKQVASSRRQNTTSQLTFEEPPVDPSVAWRTCKGSSWKFRGYTCGMWLLYHTVITASSATDGNSARLPREAQSSAFEAMMVVRAYILSFFACADCRQHFAQFKWSTPAAHPLQWGLHLQLWAAHNQVNMRLSQVREGQDPLVPKRLFPDLDLCPTCAAGGARGAVTHFASSQELAADQEAFSASISQIFSVPDVSAFLNTWYRWNESQLSAKGGAPTEEKADCGGDTCPLEPPRTNTTPKRFDSIVSAPTSSPAGGSEPVTDGVWFSRTRHPSFVVRRDHVFLHGMKTFMALVAMLGLGYSFGISSRRSAGHQQLHSSKPNLPVAGHLWQAVGGSATSQRVVSRRGPGAVII